MANPILVEPVVQNVEIVAHFYTAIIAALTGGLIAFISAYFAQKRADESNTALAQKRLQNEKLIAEIDFKKERLESLAIVASDIVQWLDDHRVQSVYYRKDTGGSKVNLLDILTVLYFPQLQDEVLKLINSYDKYRLCVELVSNTYHDKDQDSFERYPTKKIADNYLEERENEVKKQLKSLIEKVKEEAITLTKEKSKISLK
ncbi:hypothetical protein [Desulfogranum marinum]|uniref:hypothetical protein n=1 Tax=Desulfogranum marinum TaxID=453220 RepID=UPI0029C71352|nr:hypothetical protein [Desulfogranum marinum]